MLFTSKYGTIEEVLVGYLLDAFILKNDAKIRME